MTPTAQAREDAVRAWYRDHAVGTVGYLKAYDWRVIREVAGGVVGKRVLDVGPCTPADAIELAGEAASWTAIDFVPEAVDRCRVGYPAARWDVGDARALPYEAGAFDLALNLSSIDHIPTREGRAQAHRGVARVLAPGGVYVCVFSNRARPGGGLGPPHADGDYGYERWHTLGEIVREVWDGVGDGGGDGDGSGGGRPTLDLIHASTCDGWFGPRAATVWVKRLGVYA